MNGGVVITEGMKIVAGDEAEKREPYINHHFNPQHLSSLERNKIGFVGEFCACEILGINWKDNIRKSYLDIDSGDGVCKKGIYDVKTETVPKRYAEKILNHTIKDDEIYGRRLINGGQVSLLSKYDIVIFGLIIREKKDKWYPLGWLKTDYILKNYLPTYSRPDGGTYPFQALPIKTSDLKPIEQLFSNK